MCERDGHRASFVTYVSFRQHLRVYHNQNRNSAAPRRMNPYSKNARKNHYQSFGQEEPAPNFGVQQVKPMRDPTAAQLSHQTMQTMFRGLVNELSTSISASMWNWIYVLLRYCIDVIFTGIEKGLERGMGSVYQLMKKEFSSSEQNHGQYQNMGLLHENGGNHPLGKAIVKQEKIGDSTIGVEADPLLGSDSTLQNCESISISDDEQN